ncbi:MAG: hypothetical protein K6T83_14550 [Alicyclobacillus sp.]|nr:hypothetical protein [Alicyclobacillus sp.]
MTSVIVLAWIGQIVLFFLLWRLLHWLTISANRRLPSGTTLIMDLAVNLVVAIVLLMVVWNLHSPWWIMGVFGAAVGVFTGQLAGKSTRSE